VTLGLEDPQPPLSESSTQPPTPTSQPQTMNPKTFKRILLPALLLALCFLWASWPGASESPGEASVMLGRPAVRAEATRDAAPLIAPRGRSRRTPPQRKISLLRA